MDTNPPTDIPTTQTPQKMVSTFPPGNPPLIDHQEMHHKKNIYPSLRHTILVAFVLLTICVIAFLIHQNGKSIYDNGL